LRDEDRGQEAREVGIGQRLKSLLDMSLVNGDSLAGFGGGAGVVDR
jgi:hypothetical protein